MNDEKFKIIKNEFGQYKADIFLKLDFDFKPGLNLLDLGAGDCTDAAILKNYYNLSVTASDIYVHENSQKHEIPFVMGNAFDLPFESEKFDYVFMHDVLHHVDEATQSRVNHLRSLQEPKRVLKNGGTLIIIEGNRFNPLFYPHMVKMRGHEHFRQDYFIRLLTDAFPNVRFKFFEAHLYPAKLIWFFKVYERVMEKLCPKQFLAYNVAIWKKE